MAIMTCKECGMEFKRYDKRSETTFCSSQCYHKWVAGKQNPNWRGGDIEFTCTWCSKKFYIRRDRIASQSGKYCSLKCYRKFTDSYKMPQIQKRIAKLNIKNLTSWLRKGFKPKLNWEKRFGYSPEEFKLYIEKMFKDGMSWDNYGLWVIDHIKPTQFFIFESVDDEGFKDCFKLENLQPLWKEENNAKGRSYNGQYFPIRKT